MTEEYAILSDGTGMDLKTISWNQFKTIMALHHAMHNMHGPNIGNSSE